jgi:hypothetical protein
MQSSLGDRESGLICIMRGYDPCKYGVSLFRKMVWLAEARIRNG